jgi:hypothetical protein
MNYTNEIEFRKIRLRQNLDLGITERIKEGQELLQKQIKDNLE